MQAVNSALCLRHRLVCLGAVLPYGLEHRHRACKLGGIGEDNRAHGVGNGVRLGKERVEISRQALLFPFVAAAFEEPHATNVLQETGGAVYAAFVCEVCHAAIVVDNRFLHLDTHQAPSTAAEICKAGLGGGIAATADAVS